MNILCINHYAGSPALGMEYRPYYLAREWVRMGHRVLIVGATFSHVRTRQPRPGDETVDGIAYRWLATPAYQGNGVGRVWSIWRFLAQLWRQAPRLAAEFRPDAVIASSTYPMDIWVARRIARLAHAKLVYEVHDLSPIELSGMSPRHPFIRLCQAAEDAAYRDADAVVSILPKVHAHMAAHGLDLRKLAIVPNGIAPEDWSTTPPPLRDDVAATIAKHRAGGRVIVGYAGSMGEPNALDMLLDAAKKRAGERVTAGAGCGWTVMPANGAVAIDGLRRFAALSAAASRVIGARGREAVMRLFSWVTHAERLVGLCRDLMGAPYR